MLLTVKHVSYGYNPERRVLKNVSASFRGGVLTGILGPNGSGKTTLLRLLTGAIAPNAGTIALGGRSVAKIPPRKLARQMSLVAQRPEATFDFTALDVVLMGRQPHLHRFQSESPEDIRIARRAMKRLGVLSLAGRRISELSGGEWQRVVIARALCQEARVLLLDEPVSSLDLKHQIDVLRLVRDLAHRDGVACVCVLHDINLAAHYCDRLYLLHRGRIIARGAPEKVISPELLQRVYGIDAAVRIDGSGRPRIEPDYR